MRTSNEVNELFAALAKAQAKMKNPEKNKTASIPTKSGGSYSYNYADLPSTFDTVRQALADNGLSHFTGPRLYGEQSYVLFARLAHSSGQWIEAEWPLPNATDPKLLAASITYGTRYLFNGLCGIAGDDDVDGEPESPQAKYEPRSGQSRASKPVALKEPKTDKVNAPGLSLSEQFVPQFGRLTGKPLSERSTTELKEYLEGVMIGLVKAGKVMSEQPDELQEVAKRIETVLAERQAK